MVEAGELPLEQRRIKLSLQYITKLKSTPSNPAYNCVFNPQYEQKYLRNTKTITPLGIRMKPHLEDCNINLDQINDDDIYDIPPWELSSPAVNLKIHSTAKSETLESHYKQRFYEIKDFYGKHAIWVCFIQTDLNLMIMFLRQWFHLLIF